MAEYGTGRDGATWYWHSERQADGMYVAVIECYGYYVTIDGIWFYSERDCLDWIAEAAKAGVREDALTDADEDGRDARDAVMHPHVAVVRRPPGAEFTLVRPPRAPRKGN